MRTYVLLHVASVYRPAFMLCNVNYYIYAERLVLDHFFRRNFIWLFCNSPGTHCILKTPLIIARDYYYRCWKNNCLKYGMCFHLFKQMPRNVNTIHCYKCVTFKRIRGYFGKMGIQFDSKLSGGYDLNLTPFACWTYKIFYF